jgi:ADP-ribose pyrophosphatase YjhB (NUDIX family)
MAEPVVLQVGVKALLKNSKGLYLLIRKNPKKYPEMGAKWEIVGGRIDPGSPLIENLKREIKEEVNLEFSGEATLVAAQDILRNPGKHVVRLTYTGTIEGEPQLSDEALEYKWFSFEEMRKLTREELDVYFKELLDTGVISE